MKIVHVAVTAPYIDGWGYQENLLPLYQLKQGDQITIIASDIVPPYLRGKTFKTGKYINNGVTVIRIPGKKITNTLIISSSFSDLLEQEKPDIIFHHNVNCTSLITVAKYKRKHPECTVFCDNHADYINQSKSFLWRLIYYRLFIRGGLKIYGKYIDKFYGVTPQRCDYIEEVFSIPKEKVDFLPIGADVDFAKLLPSRGVLLSKYGFKETDFIIVSGGKMGKGKGTDVLINVAKELYRENANFKLLLFGKFEDKETELLALSSDFIKVEGWCDRQKTMEILKLASVAVWPIHHTTLVEDSIAVETPLILRKTRTTEHLIYKNGIFIEKGNFGELLNAIKKVDKSFYLFKTACKSMQDQLSYESIAFKIKKDSGK